MKLQLMTILAISGLLTIAVIIRVLTPPTDHPAAPAKAAPVEDTTTGQRGTVQTTRASSMTLPTTAQTPTAPAPIHTGRDSDTTLAPTQRNAILAAAAVFLDGWTETDPARRRALLTRSAAPKLSDPLIAIPRHQIPTKQPRNLQLRHSSPTSALVLGADPDVELQLLNDGQTWRVISIEPR